MFDWLVTLLYECWIASMFKADFPTFESYLDDLRLIEYHGNHIGPAAMYCNFHRLNEFSNRNWEPIRLEVEVKS